MYTDCLYSVDLPPLHVVFITNRHNPRTVKHLQFRGKVEWTDTINQMDHVRMELEKAENGRMNCLNQI